LVDWSSHWSSLRIEIHQGIAASEQGDSRDRRILDERSLLTVKLAAAARQRGHDGVATMFEDRSVALTREVALLQDLIEAGRALEPFEPQHDLETG
jgi:hypothetical protein